MLTFFEYMDSPAFEVVRFAVQRTTVTTHQADILAAANYGPTFGGQSQFKYYEIEENGGSLEFRLSGSGVPGTFITVAVANVASQLGSVDRIGLMVDSEDGAYPAILAAQWFRRV
jgi:hypothetical protein